MKLIKLITLTFVFAMGLLVPSAMAYADRCDRSSDNANTSHPDNDQNGDHNCPVDPTTTVVVDTTVPTELPHTGTTGTVVVIALIAIAAGGVLMFVRRR